MRGLDNIKNADQLSPLAHTAVKNGYISRKTFDTIVSIVKSLSEIKGPEIYSKN